MSYHLADKSALATGPVPQNVQNNVQLVIVKHIFGKFAGELIHALSSVYK